MRPVTLLAVLVTCAAGESLIGCTGPSPEEQAATKASAAKIRADAEKDSFFYMSRNFVEKRLKSPGSATFPAPREATLTKLGDNTYRVASYVDLRNDAGVLTRSHYVCEVTKISSAKWHCDNLKIRPQTAR